MVKKASGADAAQDQLTREDLRGLAAAHAVMNSRMGSERGIVGTKTSKLESKGLDPKIFKMVIAAARGRNDAGITAFKITFDRYWDLMGFNDQGDIETYRQSQPDTRTPTERAMDGDTTSENDDNVVNMNNTPRGSRKKADAAAKDVPAADPADNQAALARFKASLRDAVTSDAVTKGMERFMADHADIDEEVILEIAQERLTQLHAAADA